MTDTPASPETTERLAPSKETIAEAQVIAEVTERFANTEDADVTFLLKRLGLKISPPDLREIVASFRRQILHVAISETYRRPSPPAGDSAPTPSPSAGGNETFEQRTARVIGLLREYDLDYAADHMQAMAKRIPASAGGETELVKEWRDYWSDSAPGIRARELGDKLAAALTAAEKERAALSADLEKVQCELDAEHTALTAAQGTIARLDNTAQQLVVELSAADSRATAAESALKTAREALEEIVLAADAGILRDTAADKDFAESRQIALVREAIRALPLISETGRTA